MPHPLPDEPTRSIPRAHPPRPAGSVPAGRAAPGEAGTGATPTPQAVPLADQPTDLVFPPAGPPRQPTMPLAPVATPAPVVPEPPHRSGRAPGTRDAGLAERGRVWPWVLLSLLVVLVIAGTGVALFLLLASG